MSTTLFQRALLDFHTSTWVTVPKRDAELLGIADLHKWSCSSAYLFWKSTDSGKQFTMTHTPWQEFWLGSTKRRNYNIGDVRYSLAYFLVFLRIIPQPGLPWGSYSPEERLVRGGRAGGSPTTLRRFPHCIWEPGSPQRCAKTVSATLVPHRFQSCQKLRWRF